MATDGKKKEDRCLAELLAQYLWQRGLIDVHEINHATNVIITFSREHGKQESCGK